VTLHNAIKDAVRQAGLPDVRRQENLSGGCIYNVMRLTLEDGRHVVVKSTDATDRGVFDEEACSLQRLAQTNTVLTPAPFGVFVSNNHAVLIMESIETGRASADAWWRFGEDLSALHACDVGQRYGFEMDNHLGGTFQPNTWCDDWVTFNADYRIGHQRRLATDRGLLNAREAKRIDQVIDRLADMLPRHPKPALLHGDLWSGNALPAADDRVAVIDPASYIGDGWADIAMMKLFGGFPRGCFEAYERNATDVDLVDDRIAIYQLYHVLNHLNLFGRGYASQAMAIAQRFGA